MAASVVVAFHKRPKCKQEIQLGACLHAHWMRVVTAADVVAGGPGEWIG